MSTVTMTIGSTLCATLLMATTIGQPQAQKAVEPSESARVVAPRIKPIEEPDWTEAQRAFLQPGVSRSNNVKTCLHNLEMCRNFVPFLSYFVRPKTSLPEHAKEVLVLRTTWLCKAGYIWNAHVRRSKTLGMTDEDFLRIIEGPEAKGLSSSDAVLVRAADELHSNQFISDSTWKSLDAMFDDAQLLEAVFIVGQYHLMSMYQRSVGIELTREPNDRFLDASRFQSKTK